MSNSLVSIIVVSYGAKNYLQDCLNSIKAQTYPEPETVVINNSPEENLFYCASLNKGIKSSRGEFLLCLNDDVVLDKDFISRAIKGFLVDKRIGSVSGKILRKDKTTLDSTGLFLSIFRGARERGYGRPDRGQFDKAGFIFGVNGAVAFYRRQMLEDIREGENYFDPRFRMFYEDLDVAWRAQRKSWKAYYVPDALAFHARGASFRPDSAQGKPFARRYLNDELLCDLIKNRYLTVLKNEHIFSLCLHLIPMVLYDICAWGYILLFRPKIIKLFFRKVMTLQPL